MALPSQTDRNSQGSPVMSRGSGRNGGMSTKLIAFGGAGLVLALTVGYFVWKSTSTATDVLGPSTAVAEPPDVKTPSNPPSTATNQTPPAAGTPKTAQPPLELRQGTAPVDTKKAASSLGEALGQGGIGTATDASKPGTDTSKAGTDASKPSADPSKAGTDPTKPAPVDVSRPDNLAVPGSVPSASDPALTPSTPGALTSTGSTSSSRSVIDGADRLLAAGKLVEARAAYSRALLSSDTSKSDQELIRQKLSTISEDLVFSSKVTPGDSLTELYTVVSGDALEKIRKKRDLATEWMLIQRVNKLSSASSLKIGQKLKLVRGPFHVIVHKSEYRMDLFAGSPDEPDSWLFIRSFKVGIGENNGTPVGTFVVKSKMQNPDWKNPRTGEKFGKDDPKNPIGEYWLGWQGLGDSAPITGYGLHGTIDPASVGQSKSMGCVRLLDEDIKLVYELLGMRVSVVKVVP